MGILSNILSWLNPKTDNNETNIPEQETESKETAQAPTAKPQRIETPGDLEQLFKAYNLHKYIPAMQALARPGINIHLTPAAEDSFAVGQSKVGGQPDLPSGYEWPKGGDGKSLSFIAQFNFAELAGYDKAQLLPAKGLVYFFYSAAQDVWGFDPSDISGFNVIYTEHDYGLTRRAYPDDLPEESIFKPNTLNFEEVLCLPGWEHHAMANMIEDDDWHNYIEANPPTDNRILGYANYIQNSMELECALVTNGLYCGDATGYNSPARAEIEKQQDDWILLFQIGSEDDKTGMMWGDAGNLYFWIRKQDLAERNFEKTWCILQCY